jgi:tetratricopeptide (TPR) repeat protein
VIAAALAALALAASDADPCAPVTASGPAVPEVAAVYRAVGDAEAGAGAAGAAALAYRRAAALDPADAASRAALLRLCAAAADPLQVGVARMDAGDLRGAVAEFRAARAREDDPAAALLEGICHYELGDDAAAEPLLRAAERSSADADLARLYLGLVALRAGATARAAALLDAAARDPALARPAADLARAAREQGTWSVTFFAEAGWDSNVTLAPRSAPAADQADALGSVGLAASARPLGSSGPYLRAQGVATQQAQLEGYEVASAEGAAGWELRGRRGSARLEYQYAYRTFGGDLLLSSHQGLAGASLVLGRVVLGAIALARAEAYADAYPGYDGAVAAGEVHAGVPLGARVLVAAAYAAAVDRADAAYLSWREHGPRAEVTVALGGRVRAAVGAAAAFRRYDADDPTFGIRREETYLDAEARLAWEPGRRWTVQAGTRWRRALSNVDALEHDKLVPTVAVAYTWSP